MKASGASAVSPPARRLRRGSSVARPSSVSEARNKQVAPGRQKSLKELTFRLAKRTYVRYTVSMAIGGVIDPNTDVAAVDTAIDACFDTPLSCLSKEELSTRLSVLVTVRAKLDALSAETVRAGDTANVGQLTDQRNTANHVAATTNVDPGVIRADQRRAKWLDDLAVLAEAYRHGRIHTEHIEKLRSADNIRVHTQLIADQAKFVQWFIDCNFRDVDELINLWLLGADPDGAEPKEQQLDVGLTITPLPGGKAKVTGILDPLQASALRGAVNPEAQKIRNAHQEAGITSTVRRRTLDALMNLIGRGAARPNGTHARPRINIVLSQQVYEKTLAWLRDPSSNPLPEIDPNDIDKKCQLINGTPIHPLYALAATATATFRRLVYSARGRPLDVSYDSRRIPDWMRDATLITTNGKCSNPVCDAPFEWLHADHITPYSHTHTTRLDDTRPLCEPDNLWRSNDLTRGNWAPDPSPATEEDLDFDEYTEANIIELAQTRIRRLYKSA